MHKTKIKQILVAVGFALVSVGANAAGLGKLSVFSALGEPLKAEIEVLQTNSDELSTLSASLASQEAYQAQGVERTAIHNSVVVEVGKKSNGTPVLKLKTSQPVSDPFLDLLVQLDWATGRLQREYTVLLDPPGYKQQEAADVIAPASGGDVIVQQRPRTADATLTNSDIPSSASVKNADSSDSYTTHRGDTLLKIAKQTQVEGYNLDQMLIGLYRTNKDAFIDGNINKLRVGQIIRVPDSAVLSGISKKEAANEIKVHTQNWNKYSENLAKTATVSANTEEAGGGHADAGKISTAQEQGAASAAPGDVVKLSSNDHGKIKSGASAATKLEKVSELQEELIAKDKEVREAQEKAAMLQKQLDDMQKLLALKNKTLATAQENAVKEPVHAESKPTEVETPKVETASHPPVQEHAAVSPKEMPAEGAHEKPTVEHKVAVPEEAPPPAQASSPDVMSMLGELDPLMLGGAGGAIALLGGSWLWLRNRRKKSIGDFERGIVTSGGLKGNTVFGNTAGGTVDTGDTSFFTDFSQNADGAVVDANDVDPIAEAEVYMAYGREAQAEEILKDAIVKEPTRYELHLKLLEMLSARNDTSGFEAIAGELYTTLGSEHPVWAKVSEIGRQMEPNNPLYNAENVMPAASSVEAQDDGLDFDSPVSNQIEEMVVPDASLDDVEPAMLQDATPEPIENSNTLDFDLSGIGINPSNYQEEEDAPVMDVALEQSDVAQPELEDEIEASSALSFDIGDFKLGESAAEDDVKVDEPIISSEVEINEHAEGLNSLELPALDFEDVSPEVEIKPDTVESSLVDFELPSIDVPVSEADSLDISDIELDTSLPVESPPLETPLDFSDIDLNIADDADSAFPAEVGSAEVETKLDLAAAYLDMDDKEGARELLEEVVKEGSSGQRERAEKILERL